MQMIPVPSSNIVSIGYEENTLYVQFHSGTLYAYYNVPESVYHECDDILIISTSFHFARFFLRKEELLCSFLGQV